MGFFAPLRMTWGYLFFVNSEDLPNSIVVQEIFTRILGKMDWRENKSQSQA
jgi:hypothetical protein